MEKLIFILLAFATFSSNSFADDIFIKAGNRAENTNEIKLISSDVASTKIEVKINGFYNKKISLGADVYDNIYLPDFVSLGQPGQAALPTITKLIAVPNHRNVNVVISSSQYQTFGNYEVMPYQTPELRNTNGITKNVTVDRQYYSTNMNLPEQIVSIKEIAILRDHRVAVVTINPVQYNPATGEVRVYTDINFELRYEGNSTVNNILTPSNGISKSFQNIYKKVIFNYQPDNSFTVAPNMIIIVADSLYGSIVPYAEWKNKKGIKTTIVKRSEIASVTHPTTTQIKNYLTEQYNSDNRPEFVLFVGDSRGNNAITWFSVAGGKSDHPYQCLDGTDILPDVVVGRISVQSPAELDIAVQKFIQYERQPNMTETDWYKRAFVLHSLDGIDPINGQVAKSVFLNEGGFTNVDVVSPSASQSQITGFINGGVSWIWFIGHGAETLWADPYWPMSNMPSLNYGYKQPSIISTACNNADLDYSQTADCFGEAWIERSNPNSAAGIAAYTESCAFFTSDTIGREMLYAYFREGIYDFGSMNNYGKIRAFTYFNGNSTVIETINQMMTVGDPTQEAYSDIPKPQSVATSFIGSNFVVNVRIDGLAKEGALVAVSQNGVLKTSGYTDTQGNYSFLPSLIDLSEPVDIVATGKNLIPYEGNMILTAISQNQGSPDSYALGQNYPNPFNPSTKINFSIPKSTFVTMKVYDILGKELKTLVNEDLAAGNYSYDFNGANLTSGVYFYRITAGEFSQVKKMTLLK